jgi:hypothetical protein
MGVNDTIQPAQATTAPPTGEPSPKKGALTLGQWLNEAKKTPEQLYGDSALLIRATRALLADKGITDPTQHQLHETRFAITSALKNNTWQALTSPSTDTLLKIHLDSECCPGNVFYERDGYSAKDLKPGALKLTKANQTRLHTSHTNGCVGQIIAGTFIAGESRSSNDFSHACGDEVWENYLRAWTMLDEIPRGEFFQRVGPDLLSKIHELVQINETEKTSYLGRLMASFSKPRETSPGQFRQDDTFSQLLSLTKEEIQRVEEAGLKFQRYNPLGLSPQSNSGHIQYPAASTVADQVTKILLDFRESVSKPDAAPVALAAKLYHDLSALHPFEDSNQRTAQLLMNRLLTEAGYPPAILSHADKSLLLSKDRWNAEVMEGIAHTKRYLDKTRLFHMDSLLAREGIKVPHHKSSDHIVLGGAPFQRGTDGFLYDVTGRPHLVMDNELKPLAQLEYYYLVRRFIGMPEDEAESQLIQFTRGNLDLIKQAQNNALPPEFRLESDLSAREADSHHTIRGDSPITHRIAELLDLQYVDLTQALKISTGNGTDASSLLSKYTQLDLEYWTMEQALQAASRAPEAEAVHTQRRALFKEARAQLEHIFQAPLPLPGETHGFAYRYEEIMYQASPLQYDTLDDAIKALGDDNATIWRGDYGFSRILGMSPNNDPRQTPVRQHTEEKFKEHIVPHILQDLKALEKTGAGSRYLSHTSDLSLLTQRFGEKHKTQVLKLDTLPAPAAYGIRTFLGKTNVADSAGAPGATEGVLGESLDLKWTTGPDNTLKVTAGRRAFELKVPKASLLPGIVSLSSTHPYTHEQELHGLEKVGPLQIYNHYSVNELKQRVAPVKDPPEQD